MSPECTNSMSIKAPQKIKNTKQLAFFLYFLSNPSLLQTNQIVTCPIKSQVLAGTQNNQFSDPNFLRGKTNATNSNFFGHHARTCSSRNFTENLERQCCSISILLEFHDFHRHESARHRMCYETKITSCFGKLTFFNPHQLFNLCWTLPQPK